MDKPRQVSRLPLNQIRPSRNNPRLIKSQDRIDARAASMAQSGQSTPIKTRPLTPEEKTQEPNPEILYEIIDGELRYWAALKNGDKEIDAFILDMTPEEAFEEAIRSNRINLPGWFEDYIAMERLEKAGKHQKQQIAALFEVRNTVVGRALKILGVLNPASRELVLRNQQKLGGQRPISENALFGLTDLEDEKEVEKALPEVLERGMTEPQVRKLVEGVKGAGSPSEPAHPNSGSRLVASTQVAQPIKTQKPRKEALSGTEVASSSAAPYSGATPRAVGQPQVGQPSAEAEAASANDSNQSQHAGFKLLGQTLGSLFHWVWHNPLPFLKCIAGWGKKTATQSLEKALKQSVRREERRLFKWALWCVVLGAVWVFFHGSPIHRTAWLPKMELPRIQTNSSMNSEQASSTNSPQAGSSSTAKANSSASTQSANSPSAGSAGSPQATSTSSGRASNKMANSSSELAQPNPSMNSGQANKTGSQQGASTHVDPFAKAVGDAAGEAAKKAFNLPF